MNQIKTALDRTKNLTILNLPATVPEALAKLAERTMKLQFTIQDSQVWVTAGSETVHLDLSNATVKFSQ